MDFFVQQKSPGRVNSSGLVLWVNVYLYLIPVRLIKRSC